MKWPQAITHYQNYLKIERGLSKNSISNYTFDINKLVKWMVLNNIKTSPINIEKETLQEFIYTIAKELNPRSQGRIISGLKGFFNYLIFEEYRATNPLDLIETLRQKINQIFLNLSILKPANHNHIMPQ